jgi:predicted nucleotidyltransferase
VDQEQIIEHIQAHRARLTELGVSSLSLFGSVARGDSTETSDIDLLVRFEGRATFDRYMDLKLFLEDLLGCRVDLVTEHALRKEVRAQVEREMLRVA